MGCEKPIAEILRSKGVIFLEATDFFDPPPEWKETESDRINKLRAEEIYQSMREKLKQRKEIEKNVDVVAIHFPSEEVFTGGTITGAKRKLKENFPGATDDQIFYRVIAGKIEAFREGDPRYSEAAFSECYLFDGPLPLEDYILEERYRED